MDRVGRIETRWPICTRIVIYSVTILVSYATVIHIFQVNHIDALYAENVRIIISSLLSAQAAIISIAVSMTFVAAQLVMTSFSIQHVKTVNRNYDVWFIVIVYAVLMGLEFILLNAIQDNDGFQALMKCIDTNTMNPEDSCNVTNIDYLAEGTLKDNFELIYTCGVFSIFILIPYMWLIMRSLRIDTIIEKIITDINNCSGLKKMRNLNELFCIINNSIERKADNLALLGIQGFSQKDHTGIYIDFSLFNEEIFDELRKNILKSFILSLKYNENEVSGHLLQSYGELFQMECKSQDNDLQQKIFLDLLELIEKSLQYHNEEAAQKILAKMDDLSKNRSNLGIISPHFLDQLEHVLLSNLNKVHCRTSSSAIDFLLNIWDYEISQNISFTHNSAAILINYFQILKNTATALFNNNYDRELYLIIGTYRRLFFLCIKVPQCINSILWQYEKIALYAILSKKDDYAHIIFKNLVDVYPFLDKNALSTKECNRNDCLLSYVFLDPVIEYIGVLETIALEAISIDCERKNSEIFEEILNSIVNLFNYAISFKNQVLFDNLLLMILSIEKKVESSQNNSDLKNYEALICYIHNNMYQLSQLMEYEAFISIYQEYLSLLDFQNINGIYKNLEKNCESPDLKKSNLISETLSVISKDNINQLFEDTHYVSKKSSGRRFFYESAWPIIDVISLDEALIIAIRECEKRLSILSDFVKTQVTYYNCPDCSCGYRCQKSMMVGDRGLISLKHTLCMTSDSDEESTQGGLLLITKLLRNVPVTYYTAES